MNQALTPIVKVRRRILAPAILTRLLQGVAMSPSHRVMEALDQNRWMQDASTDVRALSRLGS